MVYAEAVLDRHCKPFTPSHRALTTSCRACKFLKHHCPSRVGIPNSETTLEKIYSRTKPVPFKFWLLRVHFVGRGLLRQHARRVASSQWRTSWLRHAEPSPPSCRAYEFFKRHCPSRVGIPNCETTQVKTYTRTQPVSFKYRLLYPAETCWR